MTKVLLVDDEERFRGSLARRLRARGYDVVDVASGEEAVKRVRLDGAINIAVLDLRMAGMDGIQTLKEMRAFNPAVQAIMLTGHGSLDSAKDAGRLEAFKYLEKPCDIEQLAVVLAEAEEQVVFAKARHEMAYQPADRRSAWRWLAGNHNSRPLFILIGAALFLGIVLAPPPARLLELVGTPKSAPEVAKQQPDPIMGYAGYREMAPGQTIATYYSAKNKLDHTVVEPDGSHRKAPLAPRETAARAKVMLAIIVVSALFWATGAVPVAVTALFVAASLYFFGIFKPDGVAQAFAKDAPLFIFGVLAMAKAITRTGLDRRIGLLLLAPARNLPLFLLVFLPLFSMSCSFLSEHAMVAFTMPLFVMVYVSALRASNLKHDRMLMVLLALPLCYAANSGGSGSPAAGGRNAIMVGILADYGVSPTFGQWVTYGMPLVPVLSLCLGLYFLLFVRRKAKVQHLDVAAEIRTAAEKIGPVTRHEVITAAVLVGVVVLWITASGPLGLGGPVILGIVLLNIFRILPWKDMQSIHWEVVFLYAGATAIGAGLASTGAALYMADRFVSVLPDILRTGSGLAIASSLFTGLATNFMSDGATVAAVGPITVPMATVAGVHPWMVGFATAFASSFAHMLIIGTPSNALAYAMAKDPSTGEQLVTLGDFFRHGFFVLLISFAVLWLWAILGYWLWIGFPAA
ncbi:MAG TPA: SLC13 family permease [Longimicrobiales bacterium]|nr:SLC13 family permease [Longimicrobiales bacterium]